MDLGPYILLGFDKLPKTTAVIDGVSCQVIFNQSAHRDNKVMGGFEPDDEGIIVVKTSDLTTPIDLKGKTVVMNSRDWRVIVVRYGETLTHLTCISIDAA